VVVVVGLQIGQLRLSVAVRVWHSSIGVGVIAVHVVAAELLLVHAVRVDVGIGVINHDILSCPFHRVSEELLDFEGLFDEDVFNIVGEIVYLIFLDL
jgi:hypothetical protein